jgi:general stress protein 26
VKEETREENIQRLGKLLQSFDVAMLTTLQPRDGILRSRPMVAPASEFDGTLWFISKFSSGKVDEIRAGSQVNLSYASESKGRYLSLSGTAYVVPDKLRMETLWTEAYRAWFPHGLDEPELVLLRVDIVEAEIWDSESGTNALLLRFT